MVEIKKNFTNKLKNIECKNNNLKIITLIYTLNYFFNDF